jgi:glutamyl-tRNA synthetase
MPTPVARTRFAPSPTGLMHVGNARTALFNALLARRLGGRFVLRIEDTDPERSRPAHVAALQEDLVWLGLQWDEGPGRGGEAGPYAQSERGAHYQALYRELEDGGKAYPCFCTESELAADRRTQAAAGEPPRYVGRCRHLSRAQVESRRADGHLSTLRFRVPSGKVIEFDDMVRGPQRVDCDHIGDFIIRRSDGTPAFFFGNAVDDADMGITHVLRGEDHLTNTPRQILLLEALGRAVPLYGHLALIVAEGGAPLSKRHGARAVADLRREGYLPEAVINYLARLGHAYDSEELLGMGDLATRFDTARLGRSPARYDEAQLRHWQAAAVRDLEGGRIWEWLGDEAGSLVPAERKAAFADAIRHNVTFPSDGLAWSRVFFSDDWDLATEAGAAVRAAGETYFVTALSALDAGDDPLARLKSGQGLRGKALYQPLRAALTGRLSGPDLGDVLALVPPNRVRKRLEDAIEMTKGE